MSRRPVEPPRRQPQQLRARQTVDAILEAVIRILKREGTDAVTTNRIAEIAGVSIGSVYQYFPDKRAIFAALHQRHLEEIDRVIETTLIQNVSAPLDRLVCALVDAIIDAHCADPELHDLLLSQVPPHSGGSKSFAERTHGAFLLALSARSRELKKGRDLDKSVFVVTHMIESLCHGVVRQRPPRLPLADAKAEIVRAILAYLRS
ncbi:MAG TPA: TetR/AcrR family transcriptional regulator [Terracidiphilus sp.]|jgi:AcrR family transcriptional regulator|nr:TetR/AcrR family transcriptional regulator [Terracidiphilus sp.]